MKDYEMLKLDNQLCFALYTCSRKVTKAYQPFLEKLGLTYTQYITMLALWEAGEISVKELGNRLMLDSGTLTPLLKKLESVGLVKRERAEGDERSVVVSLTPKGAELKEAAIEIPRDLACSMDISMEEAIKLRDELKKIMQRF